MIRCTGAEWKAFQEDDAYWPDGSYYEDADLRLNGVLQDDGIDVEELAPDAVVEFTTGDVFGDEYIDSLVRFFRRWQREQSTVRFVVEIPKNKIAGVLAAVKDADGEVIR